MSSDQERQQEFEIGLPALQKSARKLRKVINKDAFLSTLKTGEVTCTNPLFMLFGSHRYERVIHEFIANLLENPNLRPVGHAMTAWFLSRFDKRLCNRDLFVVDSEVKRENARFDLELTIVNRGWRVALELKVDHQLGFRQGNEYVKWVKSNSDRFVILIGTGKEKIPKHPQFKMLTWRELSYNLGVIVKENKTRCGLLSDHFMFFADFVEGIGNL